MVERLLCKQEVNGSTPLSSTKVSNEGRIDTMLFDILKQKHQGILERKAGANRESGTPADFRIPLRRKFFVNL